jgi:hypothetical protein
LQLYGEGVLTAALTRRLENVSSEVHRAFSLETLSEVLLRLDCLSINLKLL